MYDPTIGRFVSEDPIGIDAGDTNYYRYVRNDPTNKVDPTGLYEVDFHFYTIYYIFLARGWSEAQARGVAGWSQYVDDDPSTRPVDNWRNKPLLRDFHFWECTPNRATQPNPDSLRQRVADSIAAFESDQSRENMIRLGRLLHTYADTWAHEGFTGWHNDRLNTREGSIRPNIGHADAAEGGEAPDHPYNDVDRALEAAKQIYGMIPRGTGRHVPWHVATGDLRTAYEAPTLRGSQFNADRTHAQMVQAMRDLLERRFGTDYQYNPNDFARNRQDYLNAIELPAE